MHGLLMGGEGVGGTSNVYMVLSVDGKENATGMRT